MVSEVFFAQRRATQGGGLLDKIEQLFDVAGFSRLMREGELVALKLNFGERGNTTAIRPEMIKRVVKKVRQTGGEPFLTDSNRLQGARRNAARHLHTAKDHGFSIHTVDAPLVVADGIAGKDFVPVEINGKHSKHVKIASAIHQADSLLVLNHFTGHHLTGFCGVLNNLGLGASSRNEVGLAGSEVTIALNPDQCKKCFRCLAQCPTGALSAEEGLSIDMRRCNACGDCVALCPTSAIAVKGKQQAEEYQEKMVEAFLGAVSNKRDKVGFVSFLLDITPDCDSWNWSDAPVVGDIGIIASRDPVALEQASVDFFLQQAVIPGTRLDGCEKDRLRELAGGIDWEVQLRYAEKLGLGTRDYELFII